MTSAAEQEAKQLDSVTDMVQEKELDASKATEAMAALSRPGTEVATTNGTDLKTIAVSRESIALLVEQLEVTEDVATFALREAAASLSGQDENEIVAEALRQLITS